MDATRSLDIALASVLRSFDSTVAIHVSDPLSIPYLPVIEKGDYGTFPNKPHSIMQFSNGLYHYVQSFEEHTILDSVDELIKPMIAYGIPVKWYSYGFDVSQIQQEPSSQQQMVYIDNTVDGIYYKRLTDGVVQKMYVRKTTGTQLIDFSPKVTTPREFLGVPNSSKKYLDEVRIMGVASYPIKGYPTERFYITLDDWGMFTSTGHIDHLQGYPESDLANTPPAQTIPKAPAPLIDSQPLSDVQIIKIKPDTSLFNFQWLQDDHKPVKYRVMQRIVVRDYSQDDVTAELPKGTSLDVYGTFTAKGRLLMLINRKGDQLFSHYYGVPELVNGHRIIEEYPDYSELSTVEPEIPRPRTTIADHMWHRASLIERSIIKRIQSWTRSKK